MRVLVTNDDGLHAPGLAALARAAAEAGHEVTAIAPEGDRSGSSAAIGNLGDGSYLRYREMPLAGLEGVHSIEMDAPPALCVLAAFLKAFGDPPELVLSGVNPGLNTGRVTLFSGTVGAALTAAQCGVPAVAVSIAGHEAEVRNWHVAASLAVEAAAWAEGRMAAGELVTLNLSVPDRPRHELLPARSATIAPLGVIHTEVIDRTPERIELGFRPTTAELPEGSDSRLVTEGHVVVTPLRGITRAEVGGTEELLAALQSGRGA
jgi:5'-nucleotidase